MKPRRLKVYVKTEGMDELKKLLDEAVELMRKLEITIEKINRSEIKVIAELPEKRRVQNADDKTRFEVVGDYR